MHKFVAFLRGVNVGGKGLVNMGKLSESLTKAGFSNVRTYIQSGNILFVSDDQNTDSLAQQIKTVIQNQFNLTIEVVVFSKTEWQQIIKAAPECWGKNPDWKHNILILIKPFSMRDVIQSNGELKADIETLIPGDGVLYQSMSLKMFGRTTTGKLASKPIYKKITIRNYNTATKILTLLA